LQKQGIAEFWNTVMDYREALQRSGEFAAKRRHQALAWMWELIDSGLRSRFRSHPRCAQDLPGAARGRRGGQHHPFGRSACGCSAIFIWAEEQNSDRQTEI
jgi:LAO/AO transport system kinase